MGLCWGERYPIRISKASSSFARDVKIVIRCEINISRASVRYVFTAEIADEMLANFNTWTKLMVTLDLG